MKQNPFKVGDRRAKRIGESPYFITIDGEIVNSRTGKILKGWGSSAGYRSAIITWEGTREMVRHHHLVMRWFVGPRPPGMVINHKNGIKTDNRLPNLEYCTPKQNRDHAVVNRLYHSGERCSWSKLNGESIHLIRRAYKIGMSNRQLALAFGVSKKAIQQILKGKSWKYV